MTILQKVFMGSIFLAVTNLSLAKAEIKESHRSMELEEKLQPIQLGCKNGWEYDKKQLNQSFLVVKCSASKDQSAVRLICKGQGTIIEHRQTATAPIMLLCTLK